MDKQREMFEAWCQYEGVKLHDEEAKTCWLAWQAAIAAQWQPIETAPKDDTRIIIFSERRGAREARFYRENEEGTEWFDVIVGGGPMTHIYDATHWMPLPPHPNN